MSRIKKEILNKLKEYAGKMGRDHLGGDDYTSKKKGGLRDFDGYDNVDYNKDMPMDEASRGTIHKAAKKGSYPVSLVVVKDGKVINQVLNIKTPAEVPAAFNVVKNYHKHKGATVHIEDRTGKRLFSESVNEDSPESSHPQGSKKLTNRTTVMDMLDVISHKEFGPDYHKLSTKQKKEVHKLAIKGKLIKQSPFKESVNEAKVETERYFGKKGIIIMIRDGNKMISAIFKDKKNADKFNRNNPADVKKLLQLAKKTKYPKAIDESVNEAKVNYNFSADELKRVLKLLGRNASTEVKMIKAFEKAFGRKLTRDELFEGKLTEAFKKGDKVKYLGHPGIITNVSDYNGKTYYSVAYNKGTGKTKAKGILSTDGSITEGKLNEMDINDPILVAIRARKTDLKKKAALPKVKKISTKQYYKLMDAEIDLIDQMKDAAKDYERLDSEMNQDAGQKGDAWTDADANRYGGDLNKLQTRIEKLAKQKLDVKKQIMKYRVN